MWKKQVIVMTHAYGNQSGVRYMTNGLKVHYVPWKPFLTQSVLPTFSGTLPIMSNNSYLGKNVVGPWTSSLFKALMYARTMDDKVVFTDHSQYGFAADPTQAICVSHTSKENTVLRPGIPAEKLYVIPYAVDKAMFKPAPERLPSDQIVIVVISRLVYRKGADLLVEVRFIIGGDGPKRVRLEEMREKPHFKIELKCWVLFHMLNSFTEAFCIAILEAASSGLLTVSTRVGGVPDVLPDDMIVLAKALTIS
ncbi:hypothetical protein Cgig2_009322 [Carnegiea gigantea]|uniref:Glycosyltransferase n=1 Tax=Carnegiea gigantea TaxID=171969 RepID=A0A9Q1JX80_9CARY|nr:hypothetical protein Cgig2_009322 [Carnegiea gigantea]